MKIKSNFLNHFKILIRVVVVCFFSSLLLGVSIIQTKKKVAFTYLTADNILLSIYEEKDSLGILSGYTSTIASPVCDDGECYAVELVFYWDVIGNFKNFTVLQNKPLTKLDHVLFTKSDYKKLKEILLTKAPSFMHLRRGELAVSQDKASKTVDAVSGATLESIKGDMVSGAVYTCYTLWHIANGDINFQMQEHTKKYLDTELIEKLLKSSNVEFHYFLVENIDLKCFEKFIDEFIKISDRYDPYFLQVLKSKLSNKLLEKYNLN